MKPKKFAVDGHGQLVDHLSWTATGKAACHTMYMYQPTREYIRHRPDRRAESAA
jgi:hypothetical protein